MLVKHLKLTCITVRKSSSYGSFFRIVKWYSGNIFFKIRFDIFLFFEIVFRQNHVSIRFYQKQFSVFFPPRNGASTRKPAELCFTF